MRKNSAAEAILSKYLEPKSPPIFTRTAYQSTEKKKGGSLSDFYCEVHAVNSQKSLYSYQNKNASEIELMMMNNRRLIEDKRNH
jgi:hypothetical protein